MTAAATPSVEQARHWYVTGAELQQHPIWASTDDSINHRFFLLLDAASVAYDLAVAERHNAWSGPTQKQAGYVYP